MKTPPMAMALPSSTEALDDKEMGYLTDGQKEGDD